MYRKKKNLRVQAPEAETTAYTLSGNAFVEGDLSVGVSGMRISPAVTPQAATPGSTHSREYIHDYNPSPSRSVGDTEFVLPDEGPAGALRLADLQTLGVLGRGNSGVVHRALHTPTGKIYALKVIPMDVTQHVRKQILQELRTLYQSQCDHFVKFYGAFFREGSICVVMEYMDGGCLAELSRKAGPIPEPLLADVARQVLRGLNYMHKERHLIHRDIKPSNILVSTDGHVRIADFGVSGQLASTISSCVSWVGTVTYMSPERIQGKSYSVFSDIWSFGLCLMELALHRYPYPVEGKDGLGFWELLDFIVEKPVPELPSTFSVEARDFVSRCLQKDPTKRPSAAALLEHPWLERQARKDYNIYRWSLAPAEYQL